MKVDYHVHTEYSHDSWTSVDDVLQTAREQELDAIAITDHDTIAGASAASEISDKEGVEIIKGVERTVPAGELGVHILALFIENLPPNDNLEELVSDVHDQNGRIVVPHPYRKGTGLLYHRDEGNISEEEAEFTLRNADAVEAVNWKDTTGDILDSLQLVTERNVSMVAGTDAHTAELVGSVCTYTDSIRFMDQTKIETATTANPTEGVKHVVENLVGHTASSSGSEIWKEFVRAGAKLCNLFPGKEPNDTGKRLLKRLRGLRGKVESSRASSSKTRTWIYRPEASSKIETAPIKD